MKKSFSIIVPCFNTEAYIEKCLDSLVNQKYDISLLQIIVINDGSTNNGVETKVKKYIEKYPNIEYYYKKNNNWGSVINYAIENKLAKNDYVSILDSDDFLDLKCFATINRLIGDNDLFAGSIRTWDGKKNKYYRSPYYFLFKRQITKKRQMQTPICLPILFYYKKEIFYKVKKITEGIAYQDGDFTSQILSHVNKMIFSYKVIGYYYFYRPDNSVNAKWNETRNNAELNTCYKFLEYNQQELIAYRLPYFDYRNILTSKKIILDVPRKFDFSWLPFYLKFIYNIWFLILFKKHFRIKIKKSNKK